MWQGSKKTRQMVLLTIGACLLLSMMVLMQQGFSIRVVRMSQQEKQTAWKFRENAQGIGFPTSPGKVLNHLPVRKETKRTTSTPKRTTRTPTRTPTIAVEKNPIPTKAVLIKMNEADVINLYHSYVMSPQATCNAVKRMGLVKDGGWEMCDDPLYKPDPKNCTVYSFGINYDFSYDDDMALYGCTIHSFDPSMGTTGAHLRGKKVHFYPVGISGKTESIRRGVPPKQWQLYTLGTHRKMLEHALNQTQIIDIVKMDVEGSELDSIEAAIREGSLEDIKQLSLETHLSFSGNPPKSRYIQYLDMLRKLYDIGFRIYLTARNHVWSSFMSKPIHKQRVTCHEINMVNIYNKNKL